MGQTNTSRSDMGYNFEQIRQYQQFKMYHNLGNIDASTNKRGDLLYEYLVQNSWAEMGDLYEWKYGSSQIRTDLELF